MHRIEPATSWPGMPAARRGAAFGRLCLGRGPRRGGSQPL